MTDEKLQKRKLPLKEYTESFKDESFSDSPAAEKKAADAAEINGHKSEFSMEEILRYVEISRTRGEKIVNPHGLATSVYKSGEMDAFIKSVLYLSVLYLEAEISETDKRRNEALALLIDVAIEDPTGLADFEKYYAPEDWAWLMENLKTDD